MYYYEIRYPEKRIELSGASGNYIWEGQLSAVTPKLYEDSGIPPTVWR